MRYRKYKICADRDIAEKEFKIIPLNFKKKPITAVIFRFQQKLYAYINQCVHMPRRLNCESSTIFDPDHKFLRCSMHGIVYQPETGESISTMCHGERLQAIRVKVHENTIYIDDKRVSGVHIDR